MEREEYRKMYDAIPQSKTAEVVATCCDSDNPLKKKYYHVYKYSLKKEEPAEEEDPADELADKEE